MGQVSYHESVSKAKSQILFAVSFIVAKDIENLFSNNIRRTTEDMSNYLVVKDIDELLREKLSLDNIEHLGKSDSKKIHITAASELLFLSDCQFSDSSESFKKSVMDDIKCNSGDLPPLEAELNSLLKFLYLNVQATAFDAIEDISRSVERFLISNSEDGDIEYAVDEGTCSTTFPETLSDQAPTSIKIETESHGNITASFYEDEKLVYWSHPLAIADVYFKY